METYTNAQPAQRRVAIPFGGTPTSIDAFAYKDDVMVHEFLTTTVANGEISVTVPLFLNQYDGDLDIHFSVTFQEEGEIYTVNRSVPVQMVTPILTASEIRAIDPVVFASDAEVAKIERSVRLVIQAYTGQEFGQYIGEQSVKGTGSNVLFLPRKLLALTTFNGMASADAFFQISDEGYTLRYHNFGVPPVKADAWGLHMHTGGVIHNPNHISLKTFNDNVLYRIYGNWGYEEVPSAVKEAAKLLTNDYACADAQYRDRYLTSMTAADWRIQFHSGAFTRTGNVRADQLLSDYVVTRGWGVI